MFATSVTSYNTLNRLNRMLRKGEEGRQLRKQQREEREADLGVEGGGALESNAAMEAFADADITEDEEPPPATMAHAALMPGAPPSVPSSGAPSHAPPMPRSGTGTGTGFENAAHRAPRTGSGAQPPVELVESEFARMARMTSRQ